MAKSRTTNARKMWTQDDDEILYHDRIRCAIFGCHDSPMIGTYVCIHHAVEISDDVTEMYERMCGPISPNPLPTFPPFVYYLMLGPTTVKIGTTRDVTTRVQQLRSELQYVVALERGSYEIERQRHLQFADERLGLKEDFRLSDRLKAHIETLLPQREVILKEATARRAPRVIDDQQKPDTLTTM